MKKPVSYILILILGLATGIFITQNETIWNAINKQFAATFTPFDDSRQTKWDADFKVVELKSTLDNSLQKAYFFKSKSTAPKPLVISLHTWSGNYEQKDELAALSKNKDLNYIHPDFRGVNWTKDACCSDLIRRFSAWVPISDLPAWYAQSKIMGTKYAENILACTGSKDSLNIEIAIKKSPIYWKTPIEKLNTSELQIYAGVYDGIQGSVPITHSINFYNKVMKEMPLADSLNYVNDIEKLNLLEYRKALGDFGKIADRKVFLKKKSGNLSLTLFEGNHEMLADYAFNELIKE
jgi:hypothetical protein